MKRVVRSSTHGHPCGHPPGVRPAATPRPAPQSGRRRHGRRVVPRRRGAEGGNRPRRPPPPHLLAGRPVRRPPRGPKAPPPADCRMGGGGPARRRRGGRGGPHRPDQYFRASPPARRIDYRTRHQEQGPSGRAGLPARFTPANAPGHPTGHPARNPVGRRGQGVHATRGPAGVAADDGTAEAFDAISALTRVGFPGPTLPLVYLCSVRHLPRLRHAEFGRPVRRTRSSGRGDEPPRHCAGRGHNTQEADTPPGR